MAIVKVTPAMRAQAIRDADWAGIDAQTDATIGRNVATDPDVAPLLDAAETALAMVKTLRARLGLSQSAFAARYQIPVGTLRDWEQNRRQPEAPALAYLRVIMREPDMVARALMPA